MVQYCFLSSRTDVLLIMKSKLRTTRSSLYLFFCPVVSLLYTPSLSLPFSSSHLNLGRTPLLRSYSLPPLTATTTQNNAKTHFIAAFSSLPTTATGYWGPAEMLLTLLAVSLDILQKAASTAHAENVNRALRDQCFNIGLFNSRVETAEDCRLIASELIRNL